MGFNDSDKRRDITIVIQRFMKPSSVIHTSIAELGDIFPNITIMQMMKITQELADNHPVKISAYENKTDQKVALFSIYADLAYVINYGGYVFPETALIDE